MNQHSTRASRALAVDSHAHVFVRDLPLAAQRRYAPEADATPGDYLAHLDRHGIGYGLLVQPSFLGTDNSYMLQVLQRFPQRLRGVAVLDTNASVSSMAELASQGVCGLRLNLVDLPLPDLSSTSWQQLFAQAHALGWHIELHQQAALLPACMPALLRSGCAVVVDHFGRPDWTLAGTDPGFSWLLQQADSGRVWVKLSGAYRNGDPTTKADGAAALAAQVLVQHFGAERLVWGSDWPHTRFASSQNYAANWEALAHWVPDPIAQKMILWDTPARLFGFDAQVS